MMSQLINLVHLSHIKEGNSIMENTYVKDFTSSYLINGEEIFVTAPARFSAITDELLIDEELGDVL
ncbi:hypothetical protein ABID27_001487 [Streptococcus gallinaceus]|uniref:Uncharacterized protein n=1 Tax=Streptococcus gallinaceus TaxID=165758 RepID=A0ABV2JLR5_9STRE